MSIKGICITDKALGLQQCQFELFSVTVCRAISKKQTEKAIVIITFVKVAWQFNLQSIVPETENFIQSKFHIIIFSA
jgi:hypothetical protein